MTTLATPGTSCFHTGQEGASPIVVIPTSVVCLQRWQVESLAGVLEQPSCYVDADMLTRNDALERCFLDYAQLCREAPDIVQALRRLSCTVTYGCRVNLRHAALLRLLLSVFGMRATGWESLQYAIVEAPAADVFAFLASICGEVPCLHQPELSFGAGHPLSVHVRHPSRSPRDSVGAACLLPA
jgi:hypothetical protein